MPKLKQQLKPQPTRLKKGDIVRVLLGKDRGKKAQIMAIIPDKGRAIVEGINMVKKHVKPKKSGAKGTRVNIAAPLSLSNLQFICPSCKKGTRLGIVYEGSQKLRRCRKCNTTIQSKSNKD